MILLVIIMNREFHTRAMAKIFEPGREVVKRSAIFGNLCDCHHCLCGRNMIQGF